MEFDIRIVDIDPMDAFRAYLERRIRLALGRFSRSIRRVTVQVAAAAGDRDAKVTITVNFISKDRVVLVARAGDVHGAIDRAVEVVGRTIARRLDLHRFDRAASR